MDKIASETEFQPRHLVRHFWHRRWLIVVIPIVVFVVAWLAANARRSTSYESRAVVLVRSLPRMSAEDRTPVGYTPPAFRRMFTADATLDQVRRASDSDASIEGWRGRFSANTSTEVDNTVATEYAPTVELRVRGGSAQEAVRLMNLWTEAILDQYGDLYADEARATTARAQSRAGELAAEYAEAVAAEESFRLRHQSAAARAESVARLLDGPLPAPRELLTDTLAPYGFTAGSAGAAREGEAVMEDAPSLFLTRALGDLRNLSPEEQVEALREMQAEVTAEAARTAGAMAAASASRLRLEHALRANASAAAQSEARLPLADTTDAQPGTLRILSPTVEPGGTRGRAPHFTALIAAFLALILVKIIFAMEAYVRHSLVVRDS